VGNNLLRTAGTLSIFPPSYITQIIIFILKLFPFLEAFTKSRKVTIILLMAVYLPVSLSVRPAVRPSLRPQGTTRLPMDGFS
jgi:hypothetical protein